MGGPTGEAAQRFLKRSANLLGLLQYTATDWFAAKKAEAGVDPAKVEALIAARKAARAEKNWAESDRIRDEIAAMGVTIMDRKDGTTEWEVR